MNQSKSITLKLFPIAGERAITQTLWITVFMVLTAIGAQFEIPHQPVPFTLQTFFVLLAGAMLGKRNGTISMTAYLMVGALGLPVFSQFGFGIARLLGPTGGYLLGFPVAAFVVGYLLEKNRSYLWAMVSMITGAAVIFTLGTIQLNMFYLHNWGLSIVQGFVIFSWFDLIKIVCAAAIAHQLRK